MLKPLARIAPLEPPRDEVVIGIRIIGGGLFDKGIGPLYDRIVFTKKRAINRETLIVYSPVCANELVPAYEEFVSLTVECSGDGIDKSDGRGLGQDENWTAESRTLLAQRTRRITPGSVDFSEPGFELFSLRGAWRSACQVCLSRRVGRERARQADQKSR